MNDLSSWKESRCHERSERMCYHKVTSFLKKNPMIVWGLLVLLIVLAVYFSTLKCFLEQLPPDKTTTGWEKLAQFGDSFGAINTLFTGLAFAGLIVTIWMQNKQNKEQLFEAELQNLLALLHQKKQALAIYRDKTEDKTEDKKKNFERTLITGEAAFIEIINNLIHLKYEKERYEDIKSVSQISGEMNCLSPCWIKARQYETIKRCVLYDIGVIRSWVATFFYAIDRIDKYCKETGDANEKYIDLLKSNLNRNERLFLGFSRNYSEYQRNALIKKGFDLVEEYEIIVYHCIIFDENRQQEIGSDLTFEEAEFKRDQIEKQDPMSKISIKNRKMETISPPNQD